MALEKLGWIALLAAKHLLKGKATLSWDEVQTWIEEMTNPDNYGRRYAHQKFTAKRPDGHVEVRREKLRGDKLRVSAALVLGPRNQIVASNSWDVDAVDLKLEKKFGDNLRFTIKV